MSDPPPACAHTCVSTHKHNTCTHMCTYTMRQRPALGKWQVLHEYLLNSQSPTLSLSWSSMGTYYPTNKFQIQHDSNLLYPLMMSLPTTCSNHKPLLFIQGISIEFLFVSLLETQWIIRQTWSMWHRTYRLLAIFLVTYLFPPPHISLSVIGCTDYTF